MANDFDSKTFVFIIMFWVILSYLVTMVIGLVNVSLDSNLGSIIDSGDNAFDILWNLQSFTVNTFFDLDIAIRLLTVMSVLTFVVIAKLVFGNR